MLEQTWRTYQDQGAVFVGLYIQGPESDARAFVREFDLTYPNGPDTNLQIKIDYRAMGHPVTILVDRDGNIVRRMVGIVPVEEMVSWIEEQLAGTSPS